MIFVDEKYYPRFRIEDNSPAKIINPVPEKLFERWKKGGSLDGKFPKGERFLIWKNLRIEKKFIFDR